MSKQIMLIHPKRNIYEQNEVALTSLLTLFFAENEPEETRIGIAWCVKNRSNDHRINFRRNKGILVSLILLGLSDIYDAKALDKSVLHLYGSELWDKTYTMCESILCDGESCHQDITQGSNIFFLTNEKLPSWIKGNFFKIQYGNVRFYRT